MAVAVLHHGPSRLTWAWEASDPAFLSGTSFAHPFSEEPLTWEAGSSTAF